MQVFKQRLTWMNHLSKKKLYYGFTASLVILCIIGGFLWKSHQQAKPVAEEVTLVRAMKVGQAASAANYTYSGEVRGRYESQLGFPVNTAIPYSGRITKRNVDVGSVVKPGDILMQMDSRNLQQTANTYSAQVYSAESQLKLAERNLNRYRQLYAQGAISRAALDQYESAYEVAVAGVRQSEAQYSQSSDQIDASTIYADTAGVVSAISAEVGQIVSAGQPVITVVQSGEREVEINVPENRKEELGQVQKIRVTFWALTNREAEGKIREIAPVADKITRTYKVRISLINPPPEVDLGMTATVSLTKTGQQPSLFIPLSAIYQANDAPSVWVVNGDSVNLRVVTLGALGDAKVQVLTGLNPGDVVVTAGVHKLREGQKVRISDGDVR